MLRILYREQPRQQRLHRFGGIRAIRVSFDAHLIGSAPALFQRVGSTIASPLDRKPLFFRFLHRVSISSTMQLK